MHVLGKAARSELWLQPEPVCQSHQSITVPLIPTQEDEMQPHCQSRAGVIQRGMGSHVLELWATHTVAAPRRWGEPKPPPVPWAVGWPRGCGLHMDIVEQASLGSAGRGGTGVNPKSLPAPLLCASQLWEEPQHWHCCLLSVLPPTTSELPAERGNSKFFQVHAERAGWV